jgi:hypothetical protein
VRCLKIKPRSHDTSSIGISDVRNPEFIKDARERKLLAIGQVTRQVAAKVLQFCEQARKANEIQLLIGVKHRETFQDNYLRPLMAKGWLAITIPSKPKSRLQTTTRPNGTPLHSTQFAFPFRQPSFVTSRN